MKKWFVLWILVMLVLSNLTIADPQKNRRVYVHTGITRMAAPDSFSKSWKSGINVGVGYGLKLSPRFEVNAMVNYNNFYFDRVAYENSLDLSEEESAVVEGDPMSIYTAFLNAKLLYPSEQTTRAIPYLFAGFGLFYLNYNDIEVFTTDADLTQPGDSQAVLGLRGGLGADINIENTTLFAELGCDAGLTKEKVTIFFPLKFGVVIKY